MGQSRSPVWTTRKRPRASRPATERPRRCGSRTVLDQRCSRRVLPAAACPESRQVRNPRGRLAGTTSPVAIPRDMASGRSSPAYDRVVERRRAVALARHFRDEEGLSIAEIARRLGRAEATVKAYLADPSDANKGPSWEREPSQEVASSGVTARRGITRRRPSPTDVVLRSAGCPAPPVGLGCSCSTGSRNGAARRNSPATTETRRVCRSRRSLVGCDAQKQPSRRISTIQPAIRQARSRRATGECVAAAGRPPRHGTARATPTRIANAAIPARSRRNGHGNGFAKRCAHGEHARGGAAPRRSGDYKPENGPRRPLSSTCTGAGRRPSRTPSAAPERSGVNAVDIRTRAGAWPPVNRGRRWSPRRFCRCVRRGRATPRGRGRLSAAVRRTEAQIPGRRRSRPRRERDDRNQWGKAS